MHQKSEACVCLECRLRQQITGHATAPAPLNLNEALTALGEVTAEILAHADTKTAKRYAAFLLQRRKDWQKVPRVMAQQAGGRPN